jgi:hypothetical protein
MGTIIGQLFSFVLYLVAQVFFVKNLYLVAQVFFVKNLVIGGYAFCFVYVAFLLLLPFETSLVLLLLLGFLTGVAADVFYDTLGLHAAACVLLAFLRPSVLRLITPRSELDAGMKISLQSMGTPRFLLYAVSLIFVHHAFLFFVEAASWSLALLALVKTVCSTVFTVLVIVIVQYFKK